MTRGALDEYFQPMDWECSIMMHMILIGIRLIKQQKREGGWEV